jgi:two-component sensor histidine kinase
MLVSKSSVLRLTQQFRQQKWRGYAFGVLVFLLALGARFALDQLLPNGFPFLTFFPAIVLSTLIAGRGPGAICASFSLLAAWYWFIEPRQSFYMNFEVAVAVLFFAVVATVDVLVIDLMTRALDSLESLQKQTDALVLQRTTLFQELQHRTANNLMIVATSLALQEKRLKHNPEAVEALETARYRFEVLSRIQRRLQDPSNGNVPFGPYLQGLCDDFLNGADGEKVCCEVESPDVAFDQDRTTALSLIVLETVSNALKHAFKPGQSGGIQVRLASPEPGQSDYVMTIEDNGCGLPSDFDANGGIRLGMGILKGLARSLGGQVVVSAAGKTGGTIVRVNFPNAVQQPNFLKSP